MASRGHPSRRSIPTPGARRKTRPMLGRIAAFVLIDPPSGIAQPVYLAAIQWMRLAPATTMVRVVPITAIGPDLLHIARPVVARHFPKRLAHLNTPRRRQHPYDGPFSQRPHG